MSNWRIYCQDEMSYITLFDKRDQPPTSCPNSPTHVIDQMQTSMVQLSNIFLHNSMVMSVNSDEYVPLFSYISSIIDAISIITVNVRMVASIDVGTYDYTVVIVPDEIVLYESTNNDNTIPTILIKSFEVPGAVLTGEKIIDIRFRALTGTVTVRNIVIYSVIDL